MVAIAPRRFPLLVVSVSWLVLLASPSSPQVTVEKNHTIRSPDGTVESVLRTGGPAGLRALNVKSGSSTMTLEGSDLWSVRLWNKASSSIVPACTPPCSEAVSEGISPSQASYASLFTKTSSSLTYTWNSVTSAANPSAPFTVVVTASAIDGTVGHPGHIDLRIRVTADDAHAIYNTVFPRIGIRERVAGDPTGQYLITPFSTGVLIADPMRNLTIPPLSSPLPPQRHPGTLSMQFYGYYNSNEGAGAPLLFLGTRDIEGDLKEFFVERDPATPTVQPVDGPDPKNSLFVRLNRFPADNLLASVFEPAYPFIMTVLNGDWYTAARHYKAWATGATVPWTAQGPLHSDASVPQFIKDTQMFLYSTPDRCCSAPLITDCVQFHYAHEAFAHWPAHVMDHQSTFKVERVTSQISAWEGSGPSSYVNSFPGGDWGHWFPVQAEFGPAALLVKDIPGHNFVAYFNPNPYSIASPFQGYFSARFAKDESGASILSSDGSGTRYYTGGDCTTPPTINTNPQYVLDQRSTLIAAYIKDAALELKALGAKGLYLDAFHIPGVRSYNPIVTAERGLSPGGGSGWHEGRLATLDQLLADPQLSGFTYTTEGAQEQFLGRIPVIHPNHLDKTPLRFTTDVPPKPSWLIAPLFNTVYHEYTMLAEASQAVIPSHYLPADPVQRYVLFRKLRMAYATKMYFGNSLYGGSTIDNPNELIADVISADQSSSSGPTYWYEEYIRLITNFSATLKHEEAKEYVVFGERMRDPLVTDHASTVDTGVTYVPYGAEQPFVRVAAFSRADPPGSRVRLGILMANWSHADDTEPEAGDQTLDLTVDPAVYGLTGTYAIEEVRSDSAGNLLVVPYGTMNTTLGPRVFNDVPVGALSARFFRFRPLH